MNSATVLNAIHVFKDIFQHLKNKLAQFVQQDAKHVLQQNAQSALSATINLNLFVQNAPSIV